MNHGNAVDAFKWIRERSTTEHVRDDLAHEIREATERLFVAYVRVQNETISRQRDNAGPFCCARCYHARLKVLRKAFAKDAVVERNERARR